jgi:hypothetical protein
LARTDVLARAEELGAELVELHAARAEGEPGVPSLELEIDGGTAVRAEVPGESVIRGLQFTQRLLDLRRDERAELAPAGDRGSRGDLAGC